MSLKDIIIIAFFFAQTEFLLPLLTESFSLHNIIYYCFLIVVLHEIVIDNKKTCILSVQATLCVRVQRNAYPFFE